MSYTDLIIGGIAGIVSRTATAPLELRKIQEQNRFMPNTTLRDVIKKEGIAGLWKGNYANCIRIFPQMAINYAVYEYTKTNCFAPFLQTVDIQSQDLVHFLSGAAGGMVSMIAIYPLENARSRLSLQTNKAHYRSLADVIRKTPPLQLYNGLRMSLMGFAPYNAMNFMFYNKYKRLMNRWIDNREDHNYQINSQVVNLLCGGMSGMTAVTATYPTDLIRRRLQLQGFDARVPKYNGIVDCIRKIYKADGIGGFYRGLGQCYIKIFPAIAIQFWTLEQLKGTQVPF